MSHQARDSHRSASAFSWRKASFRVLVVLGVVLAAGQTASGLTINLTQDGGNAEFAAVVEAAAAHWESFILDDFEVPITYRLFSLGPGVTAVTNMGGTSGPPPRPVGATILFNQDVSWFIDPTPEEHSEFSTYEEFTMDFGGGEINAGRVYSGASLGGWDLLSTAIHEMGHALGFDPNLAAAGAEIADGDVDITAPRPHAGSSIPTRNQTHLNVNTASMWPFAQSNKRILLSDADVLTIAQVCQFEQVVSVPEPATWMLLLGGTVCMLSGRRRRRLAA